MAQPPLSQADLASIELSAFTAARSVAIGQGKSESEADTIAVAAARRAYDKALRDSPFFNVIPPINPYVDNSVYDPGDPQYVKTLDLTLGQQPPNISGVGAAASNTRGTIISSINQQLTHECGTTPYIRQFAGFCHGIAQQIANGIRFAINKALEAFGVDPALSGIAATIRRIANTISEIANFAKIINKFINDVVLVIAQIKALIEYILSLPAKLLALFKKCLQEAQAELTRAIFKTLNTGTDNLIGQTTRELSNLAQETQSLVNEANKLIDAPGRIISSIADPSTLSSSERNDLIIKLFPNNPPPDEVFNSNGNGAIV
jgi:hypothetical protein